MNILRKEPPAPKEDIPNERVSVVKDGSANDGGEDATDSSVQKSTNQLEKQRLSESPPPDEKNIPTGCCQICMDDPTGEKAIEFCSHDTEGSSPKVVAPKDESSTTTLSKVESVPESKEPTLKDSKADNDLTLESPSVQEDISDDKTLKTTNYESFADASPPSPLLKKTAPVAPMDGQQGGETNITTWSTRRKVLLDIFTTQYQPDPSATSFMDRVQEQTIGNNKNVSVKVAVLDSQESKQFFGVPLAHRGIQPTWVEVDNRLGDQTYFLDRVKLDPRYYPSREAAMVCRTASIKAILEKGFLSKLLFLPLGFLMPLKLITAGPANRKMMEYFEEHAFPFGMIEAGKIAKGFFFLSLDVGVKIINIDLLSSGGCESLVFTVPVPGNEIDYEGKETILEAVQAVGPIECSTEEELKKRLENEPRAVTNKVGDKEGDPVNLVVVGDFTTLLTAFEPRWDETEIVNLETCIKTAKSFVLGSQYRYSPVSPLFLYGRSQDFALQRARGSISERLHLRLWLTPMRFEQNQHVWVGQVSRDIGVKLAKTWNLTTHRIDPNVDDARDYVVADLRQSGHLNKVAYVNGVGECTMENPRVNLTNDPYFTNGKRAVVFLSPTKKETPTLLEW